MLISNSSGTVECEDNMEARGTLALLQLGRPLCISISFRRFSDVAGNPCLLWNVELMAKLFHTVVDVLVIKRLVWDRATADALMRGLRDNLPLMRARVLEFIFLLGMNDHTGP